MNGKTVGKGTIIGNVIAALMLAFSCIQFFYTIMVLVGASLAGWKLGGWQPDMVSFGRNGVVLYFIASAFPLLSGLYFCIRGSGKWEVILGKIAGLLSLASSGAFLTMLLTPFFSVVAR